MRPRIRALIVGLLIFSAFLAVSVIFVVGSQREPAPPAAPGLRGTQLPDGLDRRRAIRFDLADARGGRISADELRGRPYVVTFLFTNCPDVCPVIGRDIKQALSLLGDDARNVSAVAVSVDPKGDTAAAARTWLERQRLPRNFHYAIGTRAELEPVWKAYFAVPLQPGNPDSSLHTATLWLVDASGRLRTRYPAGEPVPPEDVASDLRILLAEAS